MGTDSVSRCTAGPGGTPCGRITTDREWDGTWCSECLRAAVAEMPGAPPPSVTRSDRPPRVEIPCVHLGGECRRIVPQAGGGHPGRVYLRRCAIHGECTVSSPVADVQCCADCGQREGDTASLVAPVGTRGRPGQWMGRLPRRPWEYRVSACIPHCETVEPLEAAIETLRWQTVSPYVIVVDTGSSPEVCRRLERLRREDVEIHYIRSNGYRHPSEPVAVALELAHSVCHTEYLYHTHSDCFVRRRDWLEWLLARCGEDYPVVGYEMSERTGHDEWRGTVSHTATMIHCPSYRRYKLGWNMQAWYEARGVPTGALGTWPDTESMLRLSMDEAGIEPLLVHELTCPGARHERNYTRDTDANVDHVRSYGSQRIYRGPVGQTAAAEMPLAIAEAWERVTAWRQLAESQTPNTDIVRDPRS